MQSIRFLVETAPHTHISTRKHCQFLQRVTYFSTTRFGDVFSRIFQTLVTCSASLFVTFMSFRCIANFRVDEKANPKESNSKKQRKSSNMHVVFKMGFPCTSEAILSLKYRVSILPSSEEEQKRSKRPVCDTSLYQRY